MYDPLLNGKAIHSSASHNNNSDPLAGFIHQSTFPESAPVPFVILSGDERGPAVHPPQHPI
jgi:hypothetical protein